MKKQTKGLVPFLRQLEYEFLCAAIRVDCYGQRNYEFWEDLMERHAVKIESLIENIRMTEGLPFNFEIENIFQENNKDLLLTYSNKIYNKRKLSLYYKSEKQKNTCEIHDIRKFYQCMKYERYVDFFEYEECVTEKCHFVRVLEDSKSAFVRTPKNRFETDLRNINVNFDLRQVLQRVWN